MLTRDEKADLHERLTDIEKAIEDINGPYRETVAALKRVKYVRDQFVDDEDVGQCESCLATIFASDEGTVSTDDGTFCADCVATWNEPVAMPRG